MSQVNSQLFLKMAWRNILRNGRRSLSTGLAIVFGFAGLSLLGGYILRVERNLRITSIYINHAGHLSIYKKDGLDKFYSEPRKYHLTGEEISKIENALRNSQDIIEFTAPFLSGHGLISNGNISVPFLANGVTPEIEARIQSHPEVLRWTHELIGSLATKDMAASDNSEDISITRELGILIDRPLPFDQLSPEQSDIQLAARTFDGDFNAVNARLKYKHTTGFALAEETGLIAPMPLLQQLYGTDGASYLAVFLNPGTSISSSLRRIQARLDEAGLSVDVHPFDDDRISLFYVGTMGFLYIMAGFFIFLIFSAVILSILNSITISILERRKEIGTLKSLGYTQKRVAKLFTQEATLLTLLSLSIGVVVAKSVAFAVNQANIRFYPPGIAGDMQFMLTPDLLLCLGLALPILVLVIFSSYWVAYKQVQMSVASLMHTAT